MIGKLIGNYKILEKLSESQTSAIYKAFDTQLAREVVIKVLRPRGEQQSGRLRLSVWEDASLESTVYSFDADGGGGAELSKSAPLAAVSLNFTDPAVEKITKKPFIKSRKRAGRAGGKSYIRFLLAAAIFAVIIFHSVSQITFLQNENLRLEVAAPPPLLLRNERLPEIFAAKEPAAKTSLNAAAAAKAPSKDAPTLRQPPERRAGIVSSSPRIVERKIERKKETARESRAQRLRRAERILTGV